MLIVIYNPFCAECLYAECRYAECCYTESRSALRTMVLNEMAMLENVLRPQSLNVPN